ncbi:MAG: hypothetical protein E6Q25_02150 [Acinetobacter sp.]|nr:MAG: hypothetical protein E6Q25_02150 [Acinetobacter sp.]
MSSVSYNFRIDEDLKNQSFSVFKRLGISPAQAIKLFLMETVERNTLPLPHYTEDIAPKTWNEFFDKYANDQPDDDFLRERHILPAVERDVF